MATNSTSQQLYDTLVSKDFDPKPLDLMGKDVIDPSQADLFSFEYKTENKNYGTVVVLLDSESNMEVYYGDNVGRTMESNDKNDWYDFLYLLRNLAKKNMYTFSLNNMNKLKYNMKTMAAVTEGKLLEGYYGSSKTSYSNQPMETKLIIKHSRPLGEDDARFRNIKTLFVQTNEGERFKLPFTSLTGGKAMARHVAEGGNPYDAFGQHIVEMMTEMATLQRFLRASKSKGYSGSAGELVEQSVKHYAKLKRKAKRLIGRRGYHEELEAYDPITITDLDETVNAIREIFLNNELDTRIEESLPVLARIALEASSDEEHVTTPLSIPKVKGTTTTQTSGDTKAKQYTKPKATTSVKKSSASNNEPDIMKMKIKDIPGHYIKKGLDALGLNDVKQIDYDAGAEYDRLAGQIADKISGKSTGTVSQDQVKQRYEKLRTIPYIGDKAAADFEKNIKDDPRVKTEGDAMDIDIEKLGQEFVKNYREREKRQQDIIGKPGDSPQIVVGPGGKTAPADSGYTSPIYPKNALPPDTGWSPSDEEMDQLFGPGGKKGPRIFIPPKPKDQVTLPGPEDQVILPSRPSQQPHIRLPNRGESYTEGSIMKELAEFEQWIDSLSAEVVSENPTEEEPLKIAPVPVDAPLQTHTVQQGDTLYSLAKKHGTSVDTLKQMNRQDDDLIKIGQKLNLPQVTTDDVNEDEQLEEAHAGDTCSCCDAKIDEQGKCGCGPECEHCGGQHEIEEVVDIDTGKQALKAERDPMLEDELQRILQLSK